MQIVNMLVNISMNEPDTHSVKESLAIAKAWKDAKDRTCVTIASIMLDFFSR